MTTWEVIGHLAIGASAYAVGTMVVGAVRRMFRGKPPAMPTVTRGTRIELSEEDISRAFALLMRERGIVANADISIGHRTRFGSTTYFGLYEYTDPGRVRAGEVDGGI